MYSLPVFKEELALAKKIRALGMGNIFEGSTYFEHRLERARGFINTLGKDVVFTVRDGKRITLEDQFTVVYGTKL